LLLEHPHLLLEHPHLLLEHPHLLLEHPHLLLEHPHLLLEHPHLLLELPHLLLELPHLLLELPHLYLGEPLRSQKKASFRRLFLWLASGYSRFASLIPARTDAHLWCACALGTASLRSPPLLSLSLRRNFFV
jgi:hypothetical protein